MTIPFSSSSSGPRSTPSSSQPLDLLRLRASDISHLLHTGATTSSFLVSQYLDQITAHNHAGLHLNAIISTPERDTVLAVARSRDEDRGKAKEEGRKVGSLWGVPIVLKDIMVTEQSLGMDTTCGCHAFVGAKADKNAVIVQRLLDAGLIILGKANLTEFCGLKMGGIAQTPGWSPVGGQTQSAYVEGGLVKGAKLLDDSGAGGSSSGSAVAVSAGFAPLSIGSECVGSVTTPCTRAGVYALKAAPGSVPLDGCFALSETFDCFGGIGKGAEDVALLMDVVLGSTEGTTEEGKGLLEACLKQTWEGLRIGFVDPRLWRFGEEYCDRSKETEKQLVNDYEAAVALIRKHGADVVSPVAVDGPQKCKLPDGRSPFLFISMAYARDNFKKFCSNFSSSNVWSLADIIEWNKQHSELEMPPEFPNQDDLIAAQENNADLDLVAQAIIDCRKLGTETLNKVFEECRIDIIVAPADSSMCQWPAVAAYPMAIVPYGTLKSNGRPFGVCAIARAGDEGKLVQFMSAWEKTFPERPLPKPLMQDRYAVAEASIV